MDYDHYTERLIRDKNYLQLELKNMQKKYDRLKIEVDYLRKRDATLVAVENSIPQRIEKYKQKNAPLPVIQELQLWSDMLKSEKEKLLEYEEDI